MFSVTSLFAQYKFSGQVISAEDEKPLHGITIQLKGTLLTVSSDRNGIFFFDNLKDTVTIIVSSIGFKKLEMQLRLPITHLLKLKLYPLTVDLKEVEVSTGYQTIPKERSTGSFTSVDNNLFNQQISPDIMSRLSAVASGITVDKGTNGTGNILIRGLSTINGPKSALIIVDNFPYDGDINNINPNQVENISILKDAAAASIWGARAGNGVIVITTKKGRYNHPLSIDFNANITIGTKPDLSYIRQISSPNFIDVEQLLFKNNYYDNWINDPNKRVLSPVVEILLKQLSGSISGDEANKQINVLRENDIRNDLNKYMYRHSLSQQYALNLKGGTEKLAWSTFAGYDKDLNNLSITIDRLNLRFQNTYKPVKNLQLLSAIQYTQSSISSGKTGYGNITSNGISFLPYTKIADDNGIALPVIKDYNQDYKFSAGNGKLLNWQYYPLEDYKFNTEKTNITDVLINTGLNYQIIPGFSADIKYQYERQENTVRNLSAPNSYSARNLVNRYAQEVSSGNVIFPIPIGGILDVNNQLLQSQSLRGQLNIDQTWDLHNLSAIGGWEMRSAHNSGYLNRFYGYDNDLLTYGNVDYMTQFPDFVSGGTATIPANTDISDRTTRYISYFSNVAYTYKSRYSLSLSGRRDASNLFGLKTNDQWNPFWSAGVSWNLSEEKFYLSKILPYLKLRATYGFSGNIDPSMVAVSTIAYGGSNSLYTNTPFASFRNYYNPELKWETSKMFNIALDFKSNHDRVTGSLEYFKKRGLNLFGTALIDYTAGVGTQIVKNVASMNGHGIDLELRTINTTGMIKWSSLLNFSFYKDEITDYYLSSLQGSNFITNTSVFPISGLKGYPVYSIFAYRWSGLDPQTGDPRGYLSGQISKDYTAITSSGTKVSDLRYFGSALPTKFGSFVNTIRYQNVSLNFSLVYKLGYYFRRNSINYTSLFNDWQGHSDYANRWQKKGDENLTDVPSLIYPNDNARDNFYSGSEVLVEKADHIRLQYITINYEIDKKQWRHIPFKSLQVYGSISNVGILWRANKLGIDPDFNYGLYPIVNPRTYSVGIKVSCCTGCKKFLEEKSDKKLVVPSTMNALQALLDNYNFMNTKFSAAGETS
eukprot:gene18522-22078_t